MWGAVRRAWGGGVYGVGGGVSGVYRVRGGVRGWGGGGRDLEEIADYSIACHAFDKVSLGSLEWRQVLWP
jgi:hypothetical protein